MKKVLVKGTNGFIGFHLAEMLVLSGYNFKALARYNSSNS